MNMKMHTHTASLILSLAMGAVALLPGKAQAANLQQLFDGDVIAINNTIFFNWQLDPSSDASPGSEPDFAQIEVAPTQSNNSVGLRFNAGNQWTALGEDFIDTFFSYSVATTDGTTSIVGSQLALLGFEFEDFGGAINVIQEVSDQSDNLIALSDVFVDNLIGDSKLDDSSTFNPLPELSVANSVLLFGDFDEDITRFRSFEQSFSTNVVPLPSTYGLFAMGVLTAGVSSWKRKRLSLVHA